MAGFHRSIIILAVAAAALPPPAPLSCQSARTRAVLANWDDSVQHAASLAQLDSLKRARLTGDARAAVLGQALWLIRRGDLADNRGDVELALTNAQVQANHTPWAWPDYVLARGFAVLSRKQWLETLSDGKELAEKHTDAVWRTLRLALDRDSTFPSARRFLGQLTAAQGDRFLRANQEIALRREVRQPDADPDALLAWARHQRTLRNYPAALQFLFAALRRGGDTGRIDLDLARTRLALGDSALAEQAYWDGAAHPSLPQRDAYRTDLAWIAGDSVAAQLDTLAPVSTTAWLHRFWEERAAEAGVSVGSRVREQLRRWIVVLERYRALSPWDDLFYTRVEMAFDNGACSGTDAAMYRELWKPQPHSPNDLRQREPLLDHRGLIYLRHGEPQRRLQAAGAANGPLPGGGPIVPPRRPPPGTSPGRARQLNGFALPWSAAELGAAPDWPDGPAGESWLYGINGSWHALQFRGSQALGTYAATTLTQQLPPSWTDDARVVATLPGADFVALAERINDEVNNRWDALGCFKEVREATARLRQDERAFLGAESDSPANLRPSVSAVQAFALGDVRDTTSEALLTYAISADALQRDTAASARPGYDVEFHVVAYDKAANRTVSLDTIRHFSAAKWLASDEFVAADLELGLPAGAWQITTRAGQLHGTVAVNETRTVRIAPPAVLQLSDIVTGREQPATWLATDRREFPLNYTGGWLPRDQAELFYEVRGIASGQAYRTTVTIRPASPGSRSVVSISSSDLSTGPVTYVRKSIGLSQLTPGTYTLSVTIDARGNRVTRETSLLIVSP